MIEEVQRNDGQTYAPKGKMQRVCKEDEFCVGVIGLDHGHIFGMCNGLSEAGATIKSVWDSDRAKVEAFCRAFPSAKIASAPDLIYDDPTIRLVATAAIPCNRSQIAEKALLCGKHVFSDKPGFTTLQQMERVKTAVAATGLRYGIYFSERLHVEAATYADYLIRRGDIGQVIQTVVLGPHRLNAPTRPAWFFDKAQYGGIITDIGCHQIEQILYYCGAADAKIVYSRVSHYKGPEFPEFEDFGEASLQCDNGTGGYFRVDWFTPDGLSAWGDGRTIILGTEGYIELRKYVDIARFDHGDSVYMANKGGEYYFDARNTLGYPFFGTFIRDCLDGTEYSMGQDYTFKVMELALRAEEMASNQRQSGATTAGNTGRKE
jgi:predicted dehydrogenase